MNFDGAAALGAQITAGASTVARTTAAWVNIVGEFDLRSGALAL